MFKIMTSCAFLIGFSCAADAPVNGPKSILKKVEPTDMPEIIVADRTYPDSEQAKFLFNKIFYPDYIFNFIDHRIQKIFKKDNVLTDPKSDLLQMHGILDRWAARFINQSLSEVGNDPIFPVLTAQTLVQYYLPKSYLTLFGLTYGLEAHPIWVNALCDTLSNFIVLHNIPDKTHSKNRIESNVLDSHSAGIVSYYVIKTFIDLKIYGYVRNREPKYKIDPDIQNTGRSLQIIQDNHEMTRMFDENYRIQGLAQDLVGLTPESMDINDAMTLYEVFLAWSKQNGNASLELGDIKTVVDALIQRNVRLSSGDLDEDGLSFDDYVSEFSTQLNNTPLMTRGVKRQKPDVTAYSVSELYAENY